MFVKLTLLPERRRLVGTEHWLEATIIKQAAELADALDILDKLNADASTVARELTGVDYDNAMRHLEESDLLRQQAKTELRAGLRTFLDALYSRPDLHHAVQNPQP